MEKFNIVSDINFVLVLTPRLEEGLTEEMERKLAEILRVELSLANIYLSSYILNKNYHLVSVTAPPEVSPLTAATVVMEKVNRGFIQSFSELEGWGSIYHDRVFIKSGDEIPEQQLEDILNISIEGF